MKRTRLKYKRKSTGEGELFDRLWMDRIHNSVVNGQPISEYERGKRLCFAHVIAKGQNQYPLFKLYDKNIIFLTHEQHAFWDNRSEEELNRRIAKGEDWEYVLELEEELKMEYKEALQEWHAFGCFPEGSKFYDLNPK